MDIYMHGTVKDICVYVYIDTCECLYRCVCTYIYTYIHIYMHVNIYVLKGLTKDKATHE